MKRPACEWCHQDPATHLIYHPASDPCPTCAGGLDDEIAVMVCEPHIDIDVPKPYFVATLIGGQE
jgi:hypothetical protein